MTLHTFRHTTIPKTSSTLDELTASCQTLEKHNCFRAKDVRAIENCSSLLLFLIASAVEHGTEAEVARVLHPREVAT